ncbi:Transposon Ty3-I Gag-Pol polyprotein [Vitis vinifera]|uniref:Transposon Ty3-I Gag-Pol polyprotein n=1 Tax=Vitis vinifera TaxID=29760 RepID=A0A438IFC6_VITVI|nr:Transposon Ty3-I Gag-Pol polyprotein [Vitis vinifera]
MRSFSLWSKTWPTSGGLDPSEQTHPEEIIVKKCAFHKEHGHTTETCRCLHYLVERLIKAGHLKQYLRSDAGGRDASQNHNSRAPRAPAASKVVINYINGGPSDEEYDSKRKRQKLLREASPHRDALIMSLEIGDFDVRRILVDLGSSADLVQASVISHMGHSLTGLENLGRILSGFNGSSTTSLGDIVLPVQAGSVTLNVQFSVHKKQGPARRMHPSLSPAMRVTNNNYWVRWTKIPGNRSLTTNPNFGRREFIPPLPLIGLTSCQQPDPSDRGEVDYPDWLANVVVVPKKEGKWRVCVDYTNLNNACPKDSFPLPQIDQIVDSTAGQGMLSFLDAFSGYHQIPMSPADEEKTAFITPHGLYCYKVMSFGLKNAGATYQRPMTKIFKPLVGRTVEVYIDDIVVKSKTREEHVLHLQEVFHLLRKYDMKLNPSKCAFGVSASKFLGFMVSQRGIEVSPDQVKAVMETPPPRSKKELQRLTGKLVALGCFITRFTDELRHFFLAIRKAGANGWKDSCQNAFEKIKHCLMQPPILSSPILEEKLYIYLAVSEWAISAVLFRCPHPRSRNLSTTSVERWRT